MNTHEHLLHIVDGALNAVASDRAVLNALRLEGEVLHVGDRQYDLSSYERITCLGAGKASASMARALKQVLGDRLRGGLVVTKYDHGLAIRGIRVMESGHPVPDAEGEAGSCELLSQAHPTTEKDLVFCLLSGGASALVPCPKAPVSLADKMAATKLLLDCGATIHEMNAIRKHLSRVKGGLLAKALEPASVITLIISDVVGNDLDVIGSGLTAPDESTYADCLNIIDSYGLKQRMPATVMQVLNDGVQAFIPETTKHGDPCFERVHNALIATNETALHGSAEAARSLGYATDILTSTMTGEARDAAGWLAETARKRCAEGKPLCLLAGGETTVTIRGKGKGGRNQELALALGLELEQLPGIRDRVSVACVGTDGTDGPTDAAGGIILPETITRSRSMGLAPEDYLTNNDSYHFLERAEALLVTGPTRTNVMDMVVMLVTP